jgi:hypothetical protein
MSDRKELFSMHKVRAGLLVLAVAFSIVGCNTNTSPGNIVAGPVAMELAVGTMNDSQGSLTGTLGTFLNAVASFRGQFGASAFLNPGTAMLTGPGGLNATIGNVFSYGQSPGVNLIGGFPPAYSPASQNTSGYGTGFMFPINPNTGNPILPPPPPTPGNYKLSTVVNNNGQNQNYGASATLPAVPTVLPNEPTPTYVSGGASGGGTFTVSVPAGVTETVVEIFLNGGGQVASVETKNTTATVPAGTLAQGTSYLAFAIGADYPFVEAGPPANTSMKPTLTGGNGTADLTASGVLGFTQ